MFDALRERIETRFRPKHRFESRWEYWREVAHHAYLDALCYAFGHIEHDKMKCVVCSRCSVVLRERR